MEFLPQVESVFDINFHDENAQTVKNAIPVLLNLKISVINMYTNYNDKREVMGNSRQR